MDERHQEKQRNKANRIFTEIDHGNRAIGISPQQQDLVSRPDRNAADQRPEHIVGRLIAEQKHR